MLPSKDRVEEYLKEVKEEGWDSERHWREFYELFSPYIADCIEEKIGDSFGSWEGEGISDYLQNKEGSYSFKVTPLEYSEEVHARIYEKSKSLVESYLNYLENSGNPIKSSSFLYRLKQNVGWVLKSVMCDDESGKEIFDAIIDSSRESTKYKKIQLAKDRYFRDVKDSVKAAYRKVSRYSDNIADYFFEVFIPQKYPSIRNTMEFQDFQESNPPDRNTSDFLIDTFIEKRIPLEKNCQNYQGAMFPLAKVGKIDLKKVTHGEINTFPKADSIKQSSFMDHHGRYLLQKEAFTYWDKLIQCKCPDPTEIISSFKEIARELRNLAQALQDEAKKKACKWGAIAKVKAEGTQITKRNLCIELSYLASKKENPKLLNKEISLEDLSPDTITLEKVLGQGFNKKALAMKVFGGYDPNSKRRLEKKLFEARARIKSEIGDKLV